MQIKGSAHHKSIWYIISGGLPAVYIVDGTLDFFQGEK